MIQFAMLKIAITVLGIACSVAVVNAQGAARALGTGIVADGAVQSLRVTDGGAGYSSVPGVFIVATSTGTGAKATATVANGSVASLELSAAGSGYTDAPMVLIEPPTPNRFEYVEESETITWQQAKEKAEALGGHLATVLSLREWNALAGSLPSGSRPFWLGGTDEATEGNYQWVTGEPFVYAPWGGGEPNNYDGDEDWIQAGFGGPSWNDGDAGIYAFVVEFEADNDGDSITDLRELLEYRTNPNRIDSDADGYSDADEVRLGSDPLDGAIGPKILEAFPAVGLQFSTTVGLNYVLEYSDDFKVWTRFGAPVQGTGSSTVIYVDPRPHAFRFWRLQVRLADFTWRRGEKALRFPSPRSPRLRVSRHVFRGRA